MFNNQAFNNTNMMETEKLAFLPRRVRLIISETNEAVEVMVNRPIILGRNDGNKPVDVDLTPKGGYRLGISRQHMRLAPAGEKIVATDLDSRNGSKINGQPMRPMHNYVIHTGDVLQLSGLDIYIRAIN